MKYYVLGFNGFEDELLGTVTSGNSMTDEDICECIGIELAKTEEDYDNLSSVLWAIEDLIIGTVESLSVERLKFYKYSNDRGLSELAINELERRGFGND